MRIVTPADLGMADIDLKALAITTASLNYDASGQFQFDVAIKKTLAAGTPTTGLASIGINVYRDEAKTDLIYSTNLAASMDMKVATVAGGDAANVVTFGGSGAEAIGGTLKTGAGSARVIPFVELVFEVTEVIDVVATATADIYLLVEGFNR